MATDEVVAVARPRRQEGRRAQLVEATARAIAERGLAGLRLKHIADQAGLSIGSVLYYYPDLDALLAEVHEHVVETFYWQRVSATEAVDDAVAKLTVAVQGGVPVDATDPTTSALFELHAAASRTPAHAVLLTQLWDREVSMFEPILAAGAADGTFDLRDCPRSIAETVVALEDAFDLHLASHNDSVSRELALQRIFCYLSLATGREFD